MLTLNAITKWLAALDGVYAKNRDFLTDLDAAIGDADHGINMARGFAAVSTALAERPPASIAEACKTVSMTLIKSVGGASGPLYGVLFMKAGPLLPGDSADLSDFARAMTAGVEGVQAMGKSRAGQKTLVDAWLPALEAMNRCAAKNRPDAEALAQAALAAETGMRDTIPMVATRGRASYLGERSAGHQDPGATSSWLMLKALSESV